jgi:spore maturation protein CgeB
MSTTTKNPSILIVGATEPTHVGGFFYRGAQAENLDCSIIDTRQAFGGNPLTAKFNWWVRGRVPNRLHKFSHSVLEQCRKQPPDILIATGTAPVTAKDLREIRSLGVRLVNYLTDDPWNPAHQSRWLMQALPEYDVVFTTRTANLQQLEELGCRKVQYLPFAYEPAIHYPPKLYDREFENFQSDLAFVGGADRDRVPVLAKLIHEGFDVSLWGGYWKRYPQTRNVSHGQANPPTMRRVIVSSSVALGLVREANRDEHAMRTYEVAAIGAPMLVVDTAEHRNIFGPEGECVYYFGNDTELIEKARWLRAHRDEGRELARKVRELIRGGANTYTDRLNSMITMTMSQ